MKGQLIGYKRVSSIDQNPESQLEGYELDKVFIEHASGGSMNRPELMRLLEYIREGDVLIVHSMDRLARNLDDLRKVVFSLVEQGISVKFVREGITFDCQSSPMSRLILSMMGAFAEFERSIIKERQREGIELAKKRGVYAKYSKNFTLEQLSDMKEKVKLGIPKAIVAREYNISRTLLYKILRGEKG